MSNVFAGQVLTLAQRSVVRTVRQPANIVFPLVFPLLLLAVNAGGLEAATRLPGFPTNSFVAFALAHCLLDNARFLGSCERCLQGLISALESALALVQLELGRPCVRRELVQTVAQALNELPTFGVPGAYRILANLIARR